MLDLLPDEIAVEPLVSVCTLDTPYAAKNITAMTNIIVIDEVRFLFIIVSSFQNQFDAFNRPFFYV